MINLKGKTSFFMPKGGAVIGEFVCDKIFKFSTRVYLGEKQEISDDEIVSKSCVPRPELRAYEGSHFGLSGWHISDLVIYDEPMKLNDFMRKPCDFAASCGACGHAKWLSGHRFDDCELSVTRPPQSFCYVEDMT